MPRSLLILLLCAALTKLSIVGAHLHLCLDDGTPAASVQMHIDHGLHTHVTDAGFPADTDVDVLGGLLQQLSGPFAPAALLLVLLPFVSRRPASTWARGPAPRPPDNPPRRDWPPLRGPPLTAS